MADRYEDRRRRQQVPVRDFEDTGAGEYNHNFTFSRAYQTGGYDRDFSSRTYGEYNRDFTFSEAYTQPYARSNPDRGYYYRDTDRAWRNQIDRDVFDRRYAYKRGRASGFPRREQESGWVRPRGDDVPGPYAGMGPRGYQRSDRRILEEVGDRLYRHGHIDASDIFVNVNQGVVDLQGTVYDRREKKMVERTIESVPGVVDVNNRLTIQK